MLNPDYLEHITDDLMRKHIEKAIDSIISDVARRIIKTGTVTETAEWQIKKLEAMGGYHDYVLNTLSKAVNKSQSDLLKLFKEVAEDTLTSDDAMYKAAGYNPIPFEQNGYMQRLLYSTYERTNGTLFNLTRTTANTATRQFESILDQAHMRLSSGAFSLQDVVRWGVKSLSGKGIASIVYPSGHVDYADTAFRRATLTGLNQAGLKLQERRMNELDCDYVETTAHAGARPDHQTWQGRVFKLNGSTEEYPNFYEATGYGTGEGLGGWNCRHGFYPFFHGLSEVANTREYLDELNNATVTYNGKEMSLYDATQEQRRIERNIRKWKREYKALSDNEMEATEAAVKLRSWRERETDFLKQTGLQRQNSREQVEGFGRSEAAKASSGARRYYNLWSKSIGVNSTIKSLANYYDVKYNNPLRYELLTGYVNAIEKGDISPLIGFDIYEQIAKQINTEIVGQTAANGVTIESFTSHFVDRIIGQTSTSHKGMRLCVPVDDALDALLNPEDSDAIRYLSDGDVRQTIYGAKATVTMSIRDKRLIQTNPRGGD